MILELMTIVTSQNSNLFIELRFYAVVEVPGDRGMTLDLLETRKIQVRRV